MSMSLHISKSIGFQLNAILGLFQFVIINTHLLDIVCYIIHMNCRLCGSCFSFSQVGWHMWFLKIQYKGIQYSLPMLLRYIRCFFYLPQPIIQMFGFLHTSKSLNFDVQTCLARWLFSIQFEISLIVIAHSSCFKGLRVGLSCFSFSLCWWEFTLLQTWSLPLFMTVSGVR